VLSIRWALDAGVKVVAGTDAGGHGHPANAGELVCLVRSGMAPMQAIQAGTSWAAECIGWEDRIGTVERGKLADLIVVDGDRLPKSRC
jgi:imidazolonepropionase-like amidohydrolase